MKKDNYTLDLFKNTQAIKEVATDVRKAKKANLDELATSFEEHNKKHPCRCDDCVLYRKIYYNS